MKITYTGRQVGLVPAQLAKLEARFVKIGKLLDGKRESEAHVVLSQERHLHQAEATVHYYSHELVGIGSATDLFSAIHAAAEKLEKQALKAVTKYRDNKRTPRKGAPEEQAAVEASAPKAGPEPETERRIYHVNQHKKRKPMTLDEALLEIEKSGDYVVYRDAETDRLSVLLRRRDGHFDLVEA
ncbi:MAG: ribosome hibernation-promoting factor, HPF/YfiA family [Bryobacteraceae bacterium]|jgi:putative sigma-54 modulation protein